MNVFQLVGSFLIKGADKAKADIKSTSSTAKSEFKGMGEEGAKGSEKVSQGFDKSAKAANPLIEAIKKIGAAIAAYMSIQAIKDFAQACVDAAAEVSAEASAFEQIMGDYSVEAQAKMQAVADTTGVVDTRLTGSMTSMTAKFKGLGFSVEEATDLAARGLTIASDAAAFWDKSLQDSQAALNSFINGSYEGGEAIGLFANDTQMAAYAIQQGIVSTTAEWSALDEATKQATRLEYAENMMAMSGATGQAAKEAGQYANVKANLTEKWRQFMAVIGEPLMQNVVIPAMEKLIELIDYASAGFDRVKEAVSGFGDKLQQASQWCSEHQIQLEILASAFGVLTTAIIAFNVAQAVQTAGGVAAVASLAATAIGVYALEAAEIMATVATTALSTAMAFLTSPVTLVVAAIAALIAIVVLCVKHWDELKVKAAEVWEMIKSAVSSAVSAIGGFLDGMASTAAAAFNFVLDTASSIWGSIKSTISNAINGAKDAVGNAIDTIRGFFNFEWSLPKIKLPHFSITGSFSLMPPSTPSFSVSWYSKAMDDGMILNGPTIFGFDGKNFLGGGEAGSEVVVGKNSLVSMIQQAVMAVTAPTAGGDTYHITITFDISKLKSLLENFDSIEELIRWIRRTQLMYPTRTY